MIRILHLADLHFDTIFASRRENTRVQLRQALRQAFDNAVTCAIKEEVDVVLIAGDLFDNDRLSYSTERFVIRQMERLAEARIRIIYSTGNHDPGGVSSRASRISWPSNCVLVDSTRPIVHRIVSERSAGAVNIVAAGLDSREEDSNLAAAFPVATGDEPYVGMLHTLVTDSRMSGGHKRFAPCSTEDLAGKGYCYWALGHIHVRHQVSDRLHAWYPGNIQGCTPREAGPKGGLLITIDSDNRVDVMFKEFGPVVWHNLELTVSLDVNHVDQLARMMEQAADAYLQSRNAANVLLRFVLSGSAPVLNEIKRQSDLEDLEVTLTEVLGLLDVEISTVALQPPVDLERYRNEPHVLGRALELATSLRGKNSEAALKELFGDNAVVDWASADDEMRRELLSGIEEEIVERMLKT